MDRRQFVFHTAGFGAAAVSTESKLLAQADAPRHRVAVIGHTGRGNYGHGLDTVWQRIPETTLVGVADPHDAGREKELKKLGLSRQAGFSNYEEMLDKVEADIVAVCPRHVDQHRDMILAAIRSGAKGVYVEKPFVRTPREADEVLDACEKSGTKVAVAHRNRYHPVLDVIGNLIDEGRLGRVLEVRCRGKGDRRGGGEDLWVLGSHVLNMTTALFGKPQSCSAILLQDGRPATPKDLREGGEGLGPLAGNELHARFLLEGGLVASFDSIAEDGTKNHGFGLQIIGSEGRIAIFADRDPLAYLIPGNPFQPRTDAARWLPITSGGVDIREPNPERIRQVGHHDVAATDLIRSIHEDRQPRCSAFEAALTIEMICGVFESHRRDGRQVKLPLSRRDHPLADW